MIVFRNFIMFLLLKYFVDSYIICFKNLKLFCRECLKFVLLDNRYLIFLLVFLGCIRINCVKNLNGGYYIVS